MSLIRDYYLVDVEAGGSKVINVVGRTVAIRREPDAGLVRVVAFSHDGQLISDNTLQAGEKIETYQEFQRLEVYNLEQDGRDVHITAGAGDFQSDIVEGNVTVATNPNNPLVVQSVPVDTRTFSIAQGERGPYRFSPSFNTRIAIFADGDWLFSCDKNAATWPHIPVSKGQTVTLSIAAGGTLTLISKTGEINMYFIEENLGL